jgi:hypothetical protein
MGWTAASEDDCWHSKHVANCASNKCYSHPWRTDRCIYTRVLVTYHKGMFRLNIKDDPRLTWLAIYRSWILPSNNPHRFLVFGTQVFIHKSFNFVLNKYFSWYSITAVYVTRNSKSPKKQTVEAKWGGGIKKLHRNIEHSWMWEIRTQFWWGTWRGEKSWQPHVCVG